MVSIYFGVFSEKHDQNEEERDETEADEWYDGAVEKGEKHTSKETTQGLKELALTISQSLVDLGEVLADVTRHLFYIILFEECNFLP